MANTNENVESASAPKGDSRFEIYEDEAHEWRYRLVAGNGETVVPPQGHRDPTDALRAIETLERILAVEDPDIVVKKKRA